LPDEADPDAALMLAVRAGDGAAFTALVRRWQDRVVSLAYRYLGSAADAEDLAQEVFLRVHRARETYEPSARFSTWIHRITVNASLNFLRAKKVRRSVSGTLASERRPVSGALHDPDDGGPAEPADPGEDAPPAAAEKEELARVLRTILEGLPERQRMAVLLNKYQGLSYEDCASAMELSLPALKSLLTRARLAIKEKLEPYLEDGMLPASKPSSGQE
jgi:RNA polymerase sigma-70 factor (ECF subfamily)